MQKVREERERENKTRNLNTTKYNCCYDVYKEKKKGKTEFEIVKTMSNKRIN